MRAEEDSLAVLQEETAEAEGSTAGFDCGHGCRVTMKAAEGKTAELLDNEHVAS